MMQGQYHFTMWYSIIYTQIESNFGYYQLYFLFSAKTEFKDNDEHCFHLQGFEFTLNLVQL